MKKIFMSLLLVIFLVACSNTAKNNQRNEPVFINNESKRPTPFITPHRKDMASVPSWYE